MTSLLPYIPLLPLLGFLVLLVFGKRLGNPLAGYVGAGAIGGSFVLALIVFLSMLHEPANARIHVYNLYTWFSSGTLNVSASLRLDTLSMTMVLFVTGVAFLIHLYSISYMEHDPKFHVFFIYLNLFVFSMLMLVLGGTFPVVFLGWEGVGACSYFLIAFWFERPAAASAGKKAFIMNRIGDFGFLLGSFLVFQHTGTLDVVRTGVASHPPMSVGTSTAIALLFFLAAVGKSAQLPLFTWLVDAMEGPTPVSALIHAATMVTAGVYLMARLNVYLTPSSRTTIAVIGVATAFVGATSATAQDDIKKVLAFSTVSQLGFMFLGIGTGDYVAAIFLMVTHAFYKANLFLGAGSVIHAMHDEQNLKKMGALRRIMPITSVTFIIAWLAIAGVPPLSGFWSKGDILTAAYAMSPILWAIAGFSAILTAYYMGREVFLVFYGAPRWTGRYLSAGQTEAHPHESAPLMTVPLVILAVASILAGVLDLPLGQKYRFLENWLAPVFGRHLLLPTISSSMKQLLGVGDAVFAVIGIYVAFSLWFRTWSRPEVELPLMRRAWGVDMAYDAVIARPSSALAVALDEVVDKQVIDGSVSAVGSLVTGSSTILRKLQSGYVRSYALSVVIGVVVLLGYVFLRVGR